MKQNTRDSIYSKEQLDEIRMLMEEKILLLLPGDTIEYAMSQKHLDSLKENESTLSKEFVEFLNFILENVDKGKISLIKDVYPV